MTSYTVTILKVKAAKNDFLSSWLLQGGEAVVEIISPLSPNRDQHQFSPDNIRTLSRDTVMRIDKMITKEKMP